MARGGQQIEPDHENMAMRLLQHEIMTWYHRRMDTATWGHDMTTWATWTQHGKHDDALMSWQHAPIPSMACQYRSPGHHPCMYDPLFKRLVMAVSSVAPPISTMALSTIWANTKHLLAAVRPMTALSLSSSSTIPDSCMNKWSDMKN